MTGLYVHIPFCRKICHYCDFHKMVASDKYQSLYITYLLKDLHYELNKYPRLISTIYIGGGTPSCLSIDNLTCLFSGLSNYIDLSTLTEFTFEINPEDITPELLTLLKKYFVTRLSIGVETLVGAFQNFLGRIFTFQTLQEKIKLIKDYGFNDFNLDLIYGLPNQTINDLTTDLDLILSLQPTHISTYSLILEDHTYLKYTYDKGFWQPIDEQLDSDMYFYICDYLKKHNFIHYETSNFALLGHQSKHNLIYWSNDNYLAIGPSSSSFINDVRLKRVKQMPLYYKALDSADPSLTIYAETEYLTKESHMEEELLLGLRLLQGCNKNLFYDKYQINIKEQFPNINELLKEGLLEENNNYIFIPEKYQYIANFIIVKILN